MALEIKRKESVRKAVRRIGRNRARKALEALRECDSMEAVHEVRKQVKQMRALLRLVQSGLRPSQCRGLMKKLKKVADQLAAPRDAFVKTSALSALKDHFKHELADRPFNGISRQLSDDCRRHQTELTKHLVATRKLFKAICRRFDSLRVKRGGWDIIGRGIRRTYRDGREAFRRGDETGKPEDLHEWRKRAKDLLYQVRVLCRIWPEQMQAIETDLDRLGDLLGEAHDLNLLAESDESKAAPDEPDEEAEALAGLTARREKELHVQALALGQKLYAEKPALFCKRLKTYWKRWRRERRAIA